MTAMQTPAPRLNLVPANQGVQWVRQGFRVFARRPLAFAMLLSTVMLFALVCNFVPLVGSFVWLMSLPLASLGFMLAGEATTRDQMSTPAVFLQPLKQGPESKAAQIKLGVLYAGAFVLIVVVSQLIVGDVGRQIAETFAQSGQMDPQAVSKMLAEPRLRWAWGVLLLLLTLLNIAFWHAPALVHWAGQPAGKALFFSWIACWRNRGAFVVYGLVWAGVMLAASLAVGVLFSLLGGGGGASVLVLPLSLLLMSVFYASLYFTFADCFDFNPRIERAA
jgi:hypothetical protein